METELTLSLGGLPPLSARGCYQEITPVAQGLWRRTLNGTLIYIGSEDIKYNTFISCKDKTVIATESFIPGRPMEVGCIQRIWQKVDPCRNNTPIQLQKAFISGSVVAVNKLGKSLNIQRVLGQEVVLNDRNETVFLSYRPVLKMMIKDFKLHIDEWGMTSGWSLVMEEI